MAAAAASLSAKATAASLEAQSACEELRKQVDDLTKQKDRLRTVFEEKIKQFRRVVYRTTGYRVDMPNEQVRHLPKSPPTNLNASPQISTDLHRSLRISALRRTSPHLSQSRRISLRSLADCCRLFNEQPFNLVHLYPPYRQPTAQCVLTFRPPPPYRP